MTSLPPLTPENIATLKSIEANPELMEQVIEAAKADDVARLEELIHGGKEAAA